MCQKILIGTGLWNPPVRAQIRRQGPEQITKDWRVFVQELGQDIPRRFNRTNNDLGEMRRQLYLPMHFFADENLVGRKILDLGCGDGYLVEDLRRRGADVVGLDIVLDRYQKTKSYFVQASADDTGFPDEHFDLVISVQGPITYYLHNALSEDQSSAPHDRNMIRRVFAEVRRVLKPQGVFLATPLNVERSEWDHPSPSEYFKGTALSPLPAGFRVKSSPGQDWLMMPSERNGYEFPNYWLELERTN